MISLIISIVSILISTLCSICTIYFSSKERKWNLYSKKSEVFSKISGLLDKYKYNSVSYYCSGMNADNYSSFADVEMEAHHIKKLFSEDVNAAYYSLLNELQLIRNQGSRIIEALEFLKESEPEKRKEIISEIMIKEENTEYELQIDDTKVNYNTVYGGFETIDIKEKYYELLNCVDAALKSKQYLLAAMDDDIKKP